MSETPKKVDLDAVLRAWPEAEKSPMEWEKRARALEERLRTGEPGATKAYVSDENLLATPLGQTESDGHNSAALEEVPMTMPADRERDRRSLQDLAKMAQLTPPPPSARASAPPSSVARPGEAQKDDSGIVDLAMAAASDPQASERAQSTPLASSGLFDDEPASVRPGPVSQRVEQPAPSMPPMPASAPLSAPPASVAPASVAPASVAPASVAPASVAPAATSSAQQVPAKKGKGAVVGIVLGLVAVSAAAAGGFLFLKHRADTAAQNTVAVNDTPAPEPVAKTTAAPADTAETAELEGADDGTLDLDSLPAADDEQETATPTRRRAHRARHAAAKSEKEPVAAKASSKKKEAPKLTEKDLPKAPSGPAGALGAEMAKAVGADGKPLKETPAAASTGPSFAPGSVPQKPSQGAVTSAIKQVLPSARACLPPDSAVSHATITFRSVGTVQSVRVTGGAAGKPAESCIKAALGKARVSPFAQPDYSARITVRH